MIKGKSKNAEKTYISEKAAWRPRTKEVSKKCHFCPQRPLTPHELNRVGERREKDSRSGTGSGHSPHHPHQWTSNACLLCPSSVPEEAGCWANSLCPWRTQQVQMREKLPRRLTGILFMDVAFPEEGVGEQSLQSWGREGESS